MTPIRSWQKSDKSIVRPQAGRRRLLLGSDCWVQLQEAMWICK